MPLEANPWTWSTMPGLVGPGTWRPRQQYLGLGAFGQGGGSEIPVVWTADIGPVGAAHPGLPGTPVNPEARLHSLGPIPAPPLPESLAAAGDAVAWTTLREVPALLATSDALVTRFPAISAAQVAADRTLGSDVTMSAERARQLEGAHYPERWRGSMPAFAALADELQQYLTRTPTIQLPDGTVVPSAGRATDVLAIYLNAARAGQIDHVATASPAFRSALRNLYTAAWLTSHLRSGHGPALRHVVPGGNADFAWLYTDEAASGMPGWQRGDRVVFTPGPTSTQAARALEDALAQELGVLWQELRDHTIAVPPTTAAPAYPDLAPPTARQRLVGFLTAGLLFGTMGLLYWKWSGRGRRSRKSAVAAPQGASTMLLT